MDNREFTFPKIEKALTDFINDEDGNITRNRLVTIGSLVLLMTLLYIDDAFAAHSSHRSHSSHSSHESHSSTSYIRDHTNHGSHSNHASHSDHGSHASHSSHTSHSNTSSHSNSIYSKEGDVAYGPTVDEIPNVVEPTDNSKIIELEDKVNVDDAKEASTSVLSMKLPDFPATDSVKSVGETELEFDNDTTDAIGSALILGGAGSLLAGGVSAAKLGIDSMRDRAKLKKLKKSASTYFDEYTDESIDSKVKELKDVANLDANKAILNQLLFEPVLSSGEIKINECIEKIENLQKSLDNNPKHRESAEIFASYYIPETIGIVFTYVQYVMDDAPKDAIKSVFEKAKESVKALNDAIDEKIENIYQFSTMETIAKAEALNEILGQDCKQ